MHHMTRSLTTAALAAFFACPVAALAQQRDQPQRRSSEEQQTARQTSQQTRLSAGELAAALILENHKEIALSEIAAEQAQDEKVKEFARKMIQDHRQFVQQLERFAEQAGISSQQLTLDSGADGRSTSDRNRRQAEAANPQRPEDRTRREAARPELDLSAGADQKGVEFVRLSHELATESLQSVRQDLQQKSGAKFDKCYMLGQVMAHMHMADKLKVVSSHVPAELQQTLQQGLEKTKQHLEEAKQLTKQVEEASEEKN